MSRVTHKRRELLRMLGQASVPLSRGVEVGVWEGDVSEFLLEHVPGIEELHLVDPWTSNVPRSYRCTAVTHICETQEGWDSIYESVITRFQDRPAVRVVRSTSLDCAGEFEGLADFVVLDGLHDYESVLLDIAVWWCHLRPGGVLCGDDYDSVRERQGYEGVKRAVDWFAARVNRHVDTDWHVWSIVK